MSDETKRDVFEAVWNRLAGYQVFFNGWPRETLDDYKKCYAAALPDDLPVIPQAIGVSIKEQKEKQSLGGTIFDAIFAINTLGRKGVGRVVNWIVDNNEVFARAWVLGVWRVEETGEVVKL